MAACKHCKVTHNLVTSPAVYVYQPPTLRFCLIFFLYEYFLAYLWIFLGISLAVWKLKAMIDNCYSYVKHHSPWHHVPVSFWSPAMADVLAPCTSFPQSVGPGEQLWLRMPKEKCQWDISLLLPVTCTQLQAPALLASMTELHPSVRLTSERKRKMLLLF